MMEDTRLRVSFFVGTFVLISQSAVTALVLSSLLRALFFADRGMEGIVWVLWYDVVAVIFYAVYRFVARRSDAPIVGERRRNLGALHGVLSLGTLLWTIYFVLGIPEKGATEESFQIFTLAILWLVALVSGISVFVHKYAPR